MAKEWTPDRIRKLRGKLSQADFARMIGVRANTVWRWEHGYMKPQPLSIIRLNHVELELKRRRTRR